MKSGLRGHTVTGFEPVISTLGKSHVGHYTKPANYSLMQRIIADGGEKVKRSGQIFHWPIRDLFMI